MAVNPRLLEMQNEAMAPVSDTESEHSLIRQRDENTNETAAEETLIPVENIPEILKGRGLNCTLDATLEALQTIRDQRQTKVKDASKVHPSEVDLIYAHLTSEQKRVQDGFVLGQQGDDSSNFKGFTKWCRNCCKRSNKSKSEIHSGMKPTNRLVLIVVVISLVIALAVAGTAIALIWTSAVSAMEQEISDMAQIVRENLEHYSYEQVLQKQKSDLSENTAVISEMIREVAYGNNIATREAALVSTVKVVGGIINNTFLVNTEAIELNTVLLMSSSLQLLCGKNVLNTTIIQVINEVNSLQVQPGREFVLSQAVNTTKGFRFLTDLVFKNVCRNGTCGSDPTAATPTRNALKGLTGTIVGNDYVPQLVFAAYTYVPCLNWGLVFKVPVATMKQEFLAEMVAAVNGINAGNSFNGSTEMMMLNTNVNGTVQSLTSLRFGNVSTTTTAAIAQTVLGAVVGQADGVTSGLDYRGARVLVAHSFLSSINATLVMKIDMSEIEGNMVTQLGSAGSIINQNMSGTLEVRFALKTVNANGTVGARYISAMKYPDQCLPPCSSTKVSPAMRNATVYCQSGQSTMTDYRGQQVLAGFACIPELNIGMVLKVDVAEIASSSLDQAIQYANNQNEGESSTSMEIMVATSKNTGKYTSVNDINVLSTLKYAWQCSVPQCWGPGSSAQAMLMALDPTKADSGLITENDYRPQKTISAYEMSHSLKIGLVVKVDVDEVQRPILTIVYILIGTSLGIVVLGVTVLGVSSKRMLSSMMETWERGKQAVQQQKESFGILVGALYPKFASEQLLAGETQIVVEVPDVSIMFSDIHGFAETEAKLRPEELVSWLTYVFGVMDGAAEYYHVYKIKTIGDVYFAIAGLMDQDHSGGEHNHTLRMMSFVSAVAQIFSPRYQHPEGGGAASLDYVSAINYAVKKQQQQQHQHHQHQQRRPSKTSKTSSAVKKLNKNDQRSVAGSSSSGPSSSTGSSNARSFGATCVMRYGVANGPVTAGVLHGKCPAFDVWGSAVNLAARMKGTGQPFRIHCSESVYQIISKVPNSPYVWERPHATFAKGFGNIPTYFLRGTGVSPPKELLAKMHLEPIVGYFPYEAFGAGRAASDVSKTDGSVGDQTAGAEAFVTFGGQPGQLKNA